MLNISVSHSPLTARAGAAVGLMSGGLALPPNIHTDDRTSERASERATGWAGGQAGTQADGSGGKAGS